MDQVDSRGANAHPPATWFAARANRHGQRRPLRGYWVEADLHCLLCGRLLGRLTERLLDWAPCPVFSDRALFRGRSSREPSRTLRQAEWLSCQACGGTAVLGEARWYTVYEGVESDDVAGCLVMGQ
jgi:hypothetical protein